MRISFFIGRMAGGGAEKVITILANHYIDKGNDVDLVLLLGPEVNYDLYPLNSKIRIVDLSNDGGYLSNSIRWIKSIRGYVKSSKPDKIISFIGRINALVLTATIGLNVPVLISERNDPHRDGRSKLMLLFCDYIYRRASAIVFQTNYQKNCFSSYVKRKSFIIPNPVEDPIIEESVSNPFLVATAGRLQPVKNHQMLIKAIGIVKKSIPQVKCEIYGEGGLYDSLLRQIEDAGLQDTVYLSGEKPKVVKEIAKASVFVMTSEYEGLSNALMEAMMLGKICISTDYDGIEDLIAQGENGIIVPRNNAEKLAEVLIDVIKDVDHKYHLLGENAHKKMLKYTFSAILHQWDDVISSI